MLPYYLQSRCWKIYYINYINYTLNLPVNTSGSAASTFSFGSLKQMRQTWTWTSEWSKRDKPDIPVTMVPMLALNKSWMNIVTGGLDLRATRNASFGWNWRLSRVNNAWSQSDFKQQWFQTVLEWKDTIIDLHFYMKSILMMIEDCHSASLIEGRFSLTMEKFVFSSNPRSPWITAGDVGVQRQHFDSTHEC